MPWKRYFAAGLVLVVLALIAAYLLTENDRGIAKERSVTIARDVLGRLNPGMTRTQVEQTIDGASKKRYKCSSVDVYLIGSDDPGRAGILYLRYGDDANGTQLLDQIAGLDQDMLAGYQSCPSGSQ